MFWYISADGKQSAINLKFVEHIWEQETQIEVTTTTDNIYTIPLSYLEELKKQCSTK